MNSSSESPQVERSAVNQALDQARTRLGVPQVLPESDIRTFDDLFEKARQQFSDSPAYQCMDHVLTFKDVDRLSDQFAAYLQSLDFMDKGDRVSLQLPNLLQWPVAAMAVIKAGFILVNTNPLYTSRELKHQLNDSGAKVVITLSNIASELHEIIDETAVKQVILTETADLLPTFRRIAINAVLKYVMRKVPSLRFDNAVAYRDALNKGSHLSVTPVDMDPADVAVLQYTGGTTGVSKGVMLTHKNLISCMQQVEWIYSKSDWESGSMRMVTPLPLYHIYAFSISFTHSMNNGHESVLIPNPRDFKKFAKLLKRTPFDGITGLNTLFNCLMNEEAFRGADFSRVKLTLSGGMALSKNIADRWYELTGGKICEGYGLTECSGILSVNAPENPVLGTVGCAFPGTELKIIDEDGNELGLNEPGELCFKGPQRMSGFWGRPDAMKELLDEDGYMSTGDIAIMNDSGHLSIVDRAKDMIIVSGFNVYPNEIEDVVIAHPKILECAAVAGKTDDGEYVRLFVVADESEVSVEEIRTFCKENMTAYKVPKTVTYVDEMPKSNIGKILRRELREKYPDSL